MRFSSAYISELKKVYCIMSRSFAKPAFSRTVSVLFKHLKFSRLPYGRMAILGWNLGVQNVITYHRTPDYIYYIFFLIFFRIQKTKEEQSALLKTSFCQKKDSFWFVKYSVWWQKCFQMLHKTWIEMWKVWQNDN